MAGLSPADCVTIQPDKEHSLPQNRFKCDSAYTPYVFLRGVMANSLYYEEKNVYFTNMPVPLVALYQIRKYSLPRQFGVGHALMMFVCFVKLIMV